MSFSFSKKSEEQLLDVHPDLVKVVRRALEICEIDFKVLEGVRSYKRQCDLYAQGRTTAGPVITWTMKSKHFINKETGYGHAVDLLGAPYTWDKTEPFDKVAKAMFQAADELNVNIRWGADWDRDGKARERGETDSPHYELMGER